MNQFNKLLELPGSEVGFIALLPPFVWRDAKRFCWISYQQVVLHGKTQRTRKHVTDFVARLVREWLVPRARCEFREVGLKGESGEIAQATLSERGKQIIVQN